MATSCSARETTFRGQPAVRLRAGRTSAVFLPGLGLTGVSLRHEGGEYLSLRGGLAALRSGRTSGLPLLAPWANRLSSTRYQVGGRDVDVTASVASGLVRTDAKGLPIHGLLVGRSAWTLAGAGAGAGLGADAGLGATTDAAWLRAQHDVEHPAFPFPHRILVEATVRDGELTVATTVSPSGDVAVPISFGWHPYLRVPGTPRNRLRLRLPARSAVPLDDRGLPLAGSPAGTPLPSEDAVIGHRTLDDLFALGAGPAEPVLALEGADGRSIELRCGEGYPFAQVWVPRGKPYVALEPMTAPTDALGSGAARLVPPGESFTASFTLHLR